MEPCRDRLWLLWAWASISTASWMALLAGSQPALSPPPASKLSLSLPDSIFSPRGRVQLTCSPPGRRRAEQFQFYKWNLGSQWERQKQQKEDTWEVSGAHLEPKSTFVCTYSERNSTGQLLQSAQSNPCVIPIIELPAAALSLDPKYPVYLLGERVTLTCSAPEGQQVSGHLFYKEQQNRTLKELPHSDREPHKAFYVSRDTAGKYSCAFSIQPSGCEIRSPQSSPISVVMKEHLPPPQFSVSPSRKLYRSGDLINLTCSVPNNRRRVSKVIFLKGSWSLFATRKNFTHTVRLSPQDGGEYSCRYQAVESGRQIPSLQSNIIRISVMVPEPLTTIQAVHLYETTARFTDSPGPPTSSALQVTSSQTTIEENSTSAEPGGPETPMSRSSQPTSHESISSSTGAQGSTKPLDSQGSTGMLDSLGSSKPSASQGTTKPLDSSSSRTTFTNSTSDPCSTSQTRTVSEPDNRNGTRPTGETLHLPLVAGGSAAGVLFLVFLLCLFRRKLKGNSKKSSRSFWETLDSQHVRKWSRINRPIGTPLDLQETAKPQKEVNQDWGILSKSKTVSSRRGGPSKPSKADDDADSGAEFEFPDIDPSYSLLGYPFSTFFEEGNNAPPQDTHIYEDAL